MPLPLTVSCFSKIQIGFTFLVPAHPGSPGQRAAKRVCVTVTILLHKNVTLFPISEFTISTFEYVSLRPQVPGQRAVKRMCVNGVCSLGPTSPHCKRHLDLLSRFCTAHSSMCQHTHTHARTHAHTHTDHDTRDTCRKSPHLRQNLYPDVGLRTRPVFAPAKRNRQRAQKGVMPRRCAPSLPVLRQLYAVQSINQSIVHF